jgi:cell wall-associated NlpC family hydrolase
MPTLTAAGSAPRLRRRLAGATAVAVLLALGVVTAAGPVAGAAPIDDKRKQAATLEADISANAEHLSVLYEQIKSAQTKLDAATQMITDAQTRIAAAKVETARLTKLVRTRAASVYRSATKGGGDTIFDLDVQVLSSREKYASAATERDDANLQALETARRDLRSRQRDAEQAKSSAEAEKAALDATTAEFESGQAERQRLLGQVQGDIKTLVDQAAAAKKAAASTGKNGKVYDPSQIPPASGSAGAAISYAQGQLGKPYSYGGTGPDAFDCSGLTMMSWAAAGVSMGHNDATQHNAFPHVPLGMLAPGDIVWYSGHVGLYVGNGMVIHASSSHNAVVYVPLASSGPWVEGVRPG